MIKETIEYIKDKDLRCNEDLEEYCQCLRQCEQTYSRRLKKGSRDQWKLSVEHSTPPAAPGSGSSPLRFAPLRSLPVFRVYRPTRDPLSGNITNLTALPD